MAHTIEEVMTAEVVMVEPNTQVSEVARRMRDDNIGDVLVGVGSTLSGIVTDRDLVVRILAEGQGGDSPVSMAASEARVTADVGDSPEQVARLMREHDVRRVPVLRDGEIAGIVTLGDLAVEGKEGSALADISASPPTI